MTAEAASDVPTGLQFVEAGEMETTYRFCLWAAPGDGKTVAAASAPTPILVLSADRPSAYDYAVRHHGLKRGRAGTLRETRYVGLDSLTEVFRYLQSADGADVQTVVIDPVSNIYDSIVEAAPKRADGDVDYQWVNKKLLGFITSLRRFDVHLVLVAHEKLNDGKRGDGKLYPRIGGGTLISKALAEMDVVAHIERTRPADGDPVWFAQIQPNESVVGKDGTNALGERRVANLTRWVEVMREYTRQPQAEGDFDLPWVAGGTDAAEPADTAQPAADPAAPPASQADGAGDPPTPAAPAEEPGGDPPSPDAAGSDLDEATERVLETFPGSTVERALPGRMEELLELLEEGTGLAGAAERMEITQDEVKALAKDAAKLFETRPTITGLLLGWEQWKQAGDSDA